MTDTAAASPAFRTPFAPKLLSPHTSSTTRKPKRLSIGSTFQPSPDLPIVEGENERKTARQRRHSRGLSRVIQLPNNTGEQGTGESRSVHRWTKDELLQHYSQCMKLSQENKITHKNAFDLKLIEHMEEMIRQEGGADGAMNFRVAGGTIYAGAKIYASRVDAIHSLVYKVLGSLGSGEKDEVGQDDAGDDPTSSTQPKNKKRKKNYKVLETQPSNLRLSSIPQSCTIDGCDRRDNVDAANCKSLMTNQRPATEHDILIEFDDVSSSIYQRGCVGAMEVEGEDGSTNLGLPTLTECLTTDPLFDPSDSFINCDTCLELDFNRVDLNVDELVASQGRGSQRLTEPDSSQEDMECGDGDVDNNDDQQPLDPALMEDDDVMEAATVTSSTGSGGDGGTTKADALDSALLVAVVPGEYSFFRPGVLSLFDGPGHWLKHKSARAQAVKSKNVEDEENEGGEIPSPRKKKKTTQRIGVDVTRIAALDSDPDPNKRTQMQQMSQAKRDQMREMRRSLIRLEETSDWSEESLLLANRAKVLIRRLSAVAAARDDVTIGDHVIGDPARFNYDIPDYCPPLDVGDDYDDDEATCPFPNSAYNHSDTVFPGWNDTAAPAGAGLEPATDLLDLLDGDHLIAQPRKIEKLNVAFAKRAKRIDVRKLKAVMWSRLHPSTTRHEEVAASSKRENDPVDGADKSLTEEPAATTEEAAATTDQNASASEQRLLADSENLFSSVYSSLPAGMSRSMADNLSVPLAFTCLLHLANEKQLRIEQMPNLSDLVISLDQ